MADFTKEEVLALAEEFETRLKNVSAGRGFGPGTHPDAVRRIEIFATALRAYAEAMSAVPVAWQESLYDQPWRHVETWYAQAAQSKMAAGEDMGNIRFRPLFAAPPVSAPAEPVAVKAPVKWVAAALKALEAYEADLGTKLPDGYELGRIEDSRGSASFRISAGHLRQLAALVSPPAPVAEAGAMVPAGWRLIETAPNDGQFLFLGIARRGFLEEIHIGRYSWAVNEDEENVWWSEQADDEICPTHWAPFIEVDAVLQPPAREIGEDR